MDNKIKLILKEKYINFTNGTKSITELLKQKDLGIIFHDRELEYLLKFFFIYSGNLEIQYLVVRLNKFLKRSLYCKYINGKENVVSYKNAMRFLFNIYDETKDKEQRIIGAFREVISTTMKKQEFESKNTYKNEDNEKFGICCHCGKISKPEIDHFQIPFQQILDEFITLNKIIIANVSIIKSNDVNILACSTLKNEWICYHDSKVCYRILCSFCNKSLGDYGYKKIKKFNTSNTNITNNTFTNNTFTNNTSNTSTKNTSTNNTFNNNTFTNNTSNTSTKNTSTNNTFTNNTFTNNTSNTSTKNTSTKNTSTNNTSNTSTKNTSTNNTSNTSTNNTSTNNTSTNNTILNYYDIIEI